MMTIRGDATIAAVSELRTKSDPIFRTLKRHRVVLERHKKPVAVMLNYDSYEAMESMIEFAEDYILGSLAAQRDKKSSPGDFVDIENW